MFELAGTKGQAKLPNATLFSRQKRYDDILKEETRESRQF